MRGRWGAAWLPLVLALAAPATAGELRARLDATLGMRGDDDYLQVDQESGELDPQSQSIAAGGLDLSLSYALRTLELALAYSPWREQNLDDSDLAATTHRLDFSLAGNLTPTSRLRVRERLLSAPGLDLAPAFTADTVVLTRRSDQLRHNLDVAISTDLSRRTAWEIGAQHSLRNFDDPALVDTWTAGGRTGLRFRFDERRAGDLELGYTRFDFEGRRSDVASLGAGYDVELVQDTRLRLRAGAFRLASTIDELLPDDTRVSRDQTTTGWRGGIDLSRLGELLSWNLGASHDVSAGNGLGRPSEVDSLRAGLSVPVGRRWVFGVDGVGSRQQVIDESRGTLLDGSAGSEDLLAGAETRFVTGTARASWGFADWGRLAGSYSRVWQRSDVPQFDDLSYNRYFLGLSLRIWSTGEKPVDPARQGEEEQGGTPDEEPVAR